MSWRSWKQVRAFMETKVQAHSSRNIGLRTSFPFELLPGIKELNIGGVGMTGYGLPRRKCASYSA